METSHIYSVLTALLESGFQLNIFQNLIKTKSIVLQFVVNIKRFENNVIYGNYLNPVPPIRWYCKTLDAQKYIQYRPCWNSILVRKLVHFYPDCRNDGQPFSTFFLHSRYNTMKNRNIIILNQRYVENGWLPQYWCRLTLCISIRKGTN